MDILAYVNAGFALLVFLIEIIILWYLYYIYDDFSKKYEDCEDLLVDIYTMELLEAKNNGNEFTPNIPKRIKDRINRN